MPLHFRNLGPLLSIALFWGGPLQAQQSETSCCESEACESAQVVRLNFSEPIKDLSLPEKLKPGEVFYLKIDNINLNNYQVSVNNAAVEISEPLKFPSFPVISLPSLKAMPMPAGEKADSGGANTYGFIKAKEAFLNDLEQTGQNGQAEDQALQSILASAERQLGRLMRDLEKDLSAVEEANYAIMAYRLSLLSPHGSDPLEDTNKPKLLEIQKTYLQSRTKTKHRLELAKTLLAEMETLAAQPKVIARFKANSQLRMKWNNLTRALRVISAAHQDLVSSLAQEKVDALFRSVLYLSEDRSYTSMPLQHQGDYSEMEVHIVPRDKNAGLQTYQFKLRLPEQNTWYWSVGSSMYYTPMKDERVYIEERLRYSASDTSSVFRVYDELREAQETGISTMLRYGSKFGPDTKWGAHGNLGLGLSLGTENLRPRYMLGLGLSYGQKHNVTFDAGLVLGYIQAKSNNIKVYNIHFEEYDIKPEPYTTLLKGSWFLGLGYSYLL